MKNWLLLLLSLHTRNASVRMRAWRNLKTCGAAVLHDGVYLMPDRDDCRATLDAIAMDVRNGDGTALLMNVEQPAAADFESLFDRSSEYSQLLAEVSRMQGMLSAAMVHDTLKQVRKLRKSHAAVVSIDFFPGEAQLQTAAALQQLELACARVLSPDEPHAVAGDLSLLDTTDYQGRVWATRQRPWVDRLASAWLIQRFIDSEARFVWLDSPRHCPAEALGFDFDDATFTHVGKQVTFEVLLVRFALQQPALGRLAQLVHYLDVGGVQPPEAAGVESVLAGLREAITDDDLLLHATHAVFDGLLTTFSKGSAR